MADFLTIEWEEEQICGVFAQVSNSGVRVRRAFSFPRSESGGTGDASQVGSWLKEQLRIAGVSPAPVLISLPRDESVVRRIELPDVPDEELPVLVRFQVGSKSSVPLDELHLDFLPLPRRSDFVGREVLGATISRSVVEDIRTTCRAAGLEVQSIGLAPAALAEIVARAEPISTDDHGASLVVSHAGSRVEVAVFRRQHLLFSHSARLGHDEADQSPQAIVAEVSRALVALRGLDAAIKIERVWTMVGSSHESVLAESLHRRLSCEVKPLDPFTTVEVDVSANVPADRPSFAGPIGTALARSNARVPAFDFLNPRQPPVKRDTRKTRATVYGAAAAVAALLIGGWWWMKVDALDKEIVRLQKQKTDLDKLMKAGEPTLKSKGLIDKWRGESVAWLEEVRGVAARMPSTDRVYLKSLKLDPQGATGGGKIRLEGVARDRKDISELSERFVAESDKYLVRSVTDRPSTDDNFYPRRFEVDLLIEEAVPKAKPAAKAAAGAKTPTAPARVPAEKTAAAASLPKSTEPPGGATPAPSAATPKTESPVKVETEPVSSAAAGAAPAGAPVPPEKTENSPKPDVTPEAKQP
jgi:Tfp pilus assembly PilM family ATPase/Tfp pilus assembly protein PilN